MSVDITIQETVNEVDITVNQNVITVNVTRTTVVGTTPNLTQVLTQGNTSNLSIELNNGTNLTILEPATVLVQDTATTAGVNISPSGVGIFTQEEGLGVEIKTDNISEQYVVQFPNKIGGAEEIIAMQSDLIGFGSGTVTNVSGTTNEITVSSPTTTPVVGISSNYTTARDAYADAKVANDLTASTTVAPSKTAVNTALDLKIDETAWVDYSATSTIVGWSSFTVKKINYKVLDNLMIVDFNLDGTSNASTITFTIPQNAGGTSFLLSAYIINNGAASSYAGRISTVSGSNVVTVQRDGQNTAFTASGTKRCSGQIIIQL